MNSLIIHGISQRSNFLNGEDLPQLSDVKIYVRDRGIFTLEEMPWVDFYWVVGRAKQRVLATRVFLATYMGFTGEFAVNNFVKKILKGHKFLVFFEGVDYFKLDRNDPSVASYLKEHSDDKSRVFYSLTENCFSLCLAYADTPESLVAHGYFLEVNMLYSELITSLFVQKELDDDIKYYELLEQYGTSKRGYDSILSEHKELTSMQSKEIQEIQKQELRIEELEEINSELQKESENKPRKRVSRKDLKLIDDHLHTLKSGCRVADVANRKLTDTQFKELLHIPKEENASDTKYMDLATGLSELVLSVLPTLLDKEKDEEY